METVHGDLYVVQFAAIIDILALAVAAAAAAPPS
jgi:hypothetical protein